MSPGLKKKCFRSKKNGSRPRGFIVLSIPVLATVRLGWAGSWRCRISATRPIKDSQHIGSREPFHSGSEDLVPLCESDGHVHWNPRPGLVRDGYRVYEGMTASNRV